MNNFLYFFHSHSFLSIFDEYFPYMLLKSAIRMYFHQDDSDIAFQ